eukprot:TRINITY_DN3432_c0_g1_i1.p1 TRINITY_DN3432_c0_g1~~TRINITY_DN3432_c0_g1_i1.p1  ORF type:complete len:225 (-),score=51.52 TRINITY_DN3432_c0_g1_i1:180-854(-)
MWVFFFFFFQAEDGIRDVERSRGLGDVYKRQVSTQSTWDFFFMKFLAIALLLSTVCCIFNFYHHKGTFTLGDEAQDIFGVIIVEMFESENMTYLTGMLEGPHHHHYSFEVSGTVINYTRNSDETFFISGNYVEGRIGNHRIPELHGFFNLTGTKNQVRYYGYGSDRSESHHFTIVTVGTKSYCPYYSMEEAAARAALLIGESSHDFESLNVVNYAVLGLSLIHI